LLATLTSPALTSPPPSPANSPDQAEGASARHLLGRLWREHVLRFWPLLIVASVLMTIEGAALGGFAYMIQPLFDDLFASQSMDGVGWVAFVIAGLFTLRAVAGFSQRLIIVTIGLRVTTALQSRLVRHLLGLDLRYFQDNAPGSLIERVRGDTLALQGVAASAVMSLGRDSITVLSLLAVMLYTDWLWTFLALAGLPLLMIPLLGLQRFIRDTARASREAAARLSTQLDEMFHGIQSIKLNRLEDHEDKRFGGEVRQFLRHAIRSQIGQAANPAMIDVVAAAGFVAVLYFGGAQIIAGDKSVGEFMSFFTALGLIFEPMRRLSSIAGQVQAALASLDRLYAVLEAQPTILPPADPEPLRTGDIQFNGVSFAYGDAPVLRGLNFTAEAGKTTALVGPSGAGKTTVFGLLTRLIDPQDGTVTIAGTAVDRVDLDALRNGIAVVGQETALFDDTIAHNIRLGRLDADTAALAAAARDASVDEFAAKLPDGLDTLVGPRGSSLSGGQRQRVAIARAMLKAAPILLLDEPTSALDARSEQLVQEALARLSEGRTTLVIAHRLSTIRDADKIVVLDQGRVVEEGTHDSLMAADGAYARLHELQSSGVMTEL
jgi:ATP-binding cassette subfamily B protein/subfamily B ATP-binding cassette protein MsbA